MKWDSEIIDESWWFDKENLGLDCRKNLLAIFNHFNHWQPVHQGDVKSLKAIITMVSLEPHIV